MFSSFPYASPIWGGCCSFILKKFNWIPLQDQREETYSYSYRMKDYEWMGEISYVQANFTDFVIEWEWFVGVKEPVAIYLCCLNMLIGPYLYYLFVNNACRVCIEFWHNTRSNFIVCFDLPIWITLEINHPPTCLFSFLHQLFSLHICRNEADDATSKWGAPP